MASDARGEAPPACTYVLRRADDVDGIIRTTNDSRAEGTPTARRAASRRTSARSARESSGTGTESVTTTVDLLWAETAARRRGRRAAMGRGNGTGWGRDARATPGRRPPRSRRGWRRGGACLPNVDVTVVFGRHFHLSGYPPWQLHKAEMYHRRSLRGFTRKSLGGDSAEVRGGVAAVRAVSGVTRERSTSSRVEALMDQLTESPSPERARGGRRSESESLVLIGGRKRQRASDDTLATGPASLRAPTPRPPPPRRDRPLPARRAGIDPLEHGRVLEHVRDDQKPNLAPADDTRAPADWTTVPTRVRDALQLAVPVVSLEQRSPVRLARLQLDLWRGGRGEGGQRGDRGRVGTASACTRFSGARISIRETARRARERARCTDVARVRREGTYRHGVALSLVQQLDGDADALAQTDGVGHGSLKIADGRFTRKGATKIPPGDPPSRAPRDATDALALVRVWLRPNARVRRRVFRPRRDRLRSTRVALCAHRRGWEHGLGGRCSNFERQRIRARAAVSCASFPRRHRLGPLSRGAHPRGIDTMGKNPPRRIADT